MAGVGKDGGTPRGLACPALRRHQRHGARARDETSHPGPVKGRRYVRRTVESAAESRRESPKVMRVSP